VADLVLRVRHEADSAQIKRVLILFPIVVVTAVFSIRTVNKKFLNFAIKFGVTIGLGILILTFF